MQDSYREYLNYLRKNSKLKTSFWITIEEANILADRLKISDSSLYIECGTCHGFTSCYAASVDTIKTIHTFDPANREHIWDRKQLLPLRDKITFHNLKFNEGISNLTSILAKQKVYYFIDGNHSKRAVATDFDTLVPLLKSGDRILFHDSISAYGVNNLMPRIEIRFPSWTRTDFDTERGMTEFTVN